MRTSRTESLFWSYKVKTSRTKSLFWSYKVPSADTEKAQKSPLGAFACKTIPGLLPIGEGRRGRPIKPCERTGGVHIQPLRSSKTYRFLSIVSFNCSHLPCICSISDWIGGSMGLPMGPSVCVKFAHVINENCDRPQFSLITCANLTKTKKMHGR